MADAERADQQIRLLAGSAMDDASTEACIEHVNAGPAAATTVLAVSLTDTPDTWLRRYRERADALPARLGLVVAGDPARSVGAAGGSADWRLPPTESVSVTTVDDPGDLTALGIKITDFVGQWASEGEPDEERRLVFCFDSLTVLLQYAELERTFRFLHVLVGRLRQRGIEAHFHLDPSTQDERVLKTVASLFDAVDGHLADPGTPLREG